MSRFDSDWTWEIRVNEDDEGFWVGTPGELTSVIVGVLMGSGVTYPDADPIARELVQAARQQKEARIKDWSTPSLGWSRELPDGRTLRVTSGDLPESPYRYCDGVTSLGSRCPRHMNHLGSC